MNDLSKRYEELSQLIFASLEGNLDAAQLERLRSLVTTQKWAMKYYCEYISLYSDLKMPKDIALFSSGQESILDPGLWQRLQEEERNAPAVPEQRNEPTPQPAENEQVLPDRTVRKINKAAIFTVIVSAAALVLLILWVHVTAPLAGKEVATLMDSFNVKWTGAGGMMPGQKRLAIGCKAAIKEGFVKLLFDNDAGVVIEAPAEFQILTDDQIALAYGRLYATVPARAIGFTVTTGNSKIIDLGTEFGVEAGSDGSTELHVLQGRTTLVSGQKDKSSCLVKKGQARRISAVTAIVTDINCDGRKFARDINSSSRLIWRGENLKLASIIAGGDGFQDVPVLTGINPANGEFVFSIKSEARASKIAYNPVPGSKWIDGVFVPDGGTGPIRISSGGHTFDCPNTKGLFTHEVAAFRGILDKQNTTIPPAVFNGKRYEEDSEAVVMLHSNIGITFDLQALGKSLAGLDIKSFKAWGGITEALKEAKDQPGLDFWVLVDGQVKYEKRNLTLEDNTVSFDISLCPRDCFLTLIVTDGLQPDSKGEYPYANDFLYLIKPELCVSPSDSEADSMTGKMAGNK